VSGDETNAQAQYAGRLSDYLSLGVIARIYRRDVVDQVLLETRSKEKRQRLLPAQLVVYYVIGLALFFGDAYEEVMRKMVGLRFVAAWERAWTVPTASALCQARQRLGEEPLRQLFERVAAPLATSSTIGAWLSHRWRLMAIDGVTLDVPDTPDNEKKFGRPSSRTGQGGAFPQVRVVGLGECGTHAIVAAELGPIATGERELAERLLVDLDEGMLVMFDRGFSATASSPPPVTPAPTWCSASVAS
jgi:Insertion element 4 transposase N-terminal